MYIMGFGMVKSTGCKDVVYIMESGMVKATLGARI